MNRASVFEACGREFAATPGNKTKIKRLRKAVAEFEADSSLGSVEGWADSFRESDAFRPAERLAEIIEGNDLDRLEMSEFWEFVIPSDEGDDAISKLHSNNKLLAAFVKGALTIR